MRKIISILLSITICFSMSLSVSAYDDSEIDTLTDSVGSYLYETVENPQVSSVGGEWLVLGLARSGLNIAPEYFEKYYNNVKEYVKKCEGILHDKKYTEYSRVILALTAIGKKPENIAGYNLLKPLGDYEKTVWQGVNGAVWALIAIDSGNYDIPYNPDAKTCATKEMYKDKILESQLKDGGWALSGNVADIDLTAMALQALSKYKSEEKVSIAIDKALKYISENQDENGGFLSRGISNSESCGQVLVALCELGIDINDEAFVKNGYTVFDNMMMYYQKGKGFRHESDEETANQMATEQCFYGLVALKRLNDGKNTLYNMGDVIKTEESKTSSFGLENKNTDVKKTELLSSDKTFEDIKDHKNRIQIEELSKRNIINGKAENIFDPNSTMTRAEFATITTRALGLLKNESAPFCDVKENEWFYNYVNTAYYYGIVNGVSADEFNPNGLITREQAAVMVCRAAKLCGMDTNMQDTQVRDVLAGFTDYVKSSTWAKNSLGFCYSEGILSDEDIVIKPKEAVTRAEIAVMIYNMLSLAELL